MKIVTSPAYIGWYAVDEDTYDGAPDTLSPCNFIGHGMTEAGALAELCQQYIDYTDELEQRLRQMQEAGNGAT